MLPWLNPTPFCKFENEAGDDNFDGAGLLCGEDGAAAAFD